jgi:hypothetical protein
MLFTLDRIYKINKIKTTLIHPDHPVNPVKNNLIYIMSIPLILSN